MKVENSVAMMVENSVAMMVEITGPRAEDNNHLLSSVRVISRGFVRRDCAEVSYVCDFDGARDHDRGRAFR